MTWSATTSRGLESDKVAHLVVPYLQGRALDLGCGMRKVWPPLIGVDGGQTFGKTDADIVGDIADLSFFRDETIDGVFSSHALEDFEPERVPAVLAEWWRVLKVGGHLVLYLPHQDLYPHIGEEGCNPAHKWEPEPEKVIGYMLRVGDWTLVENEVRGQADEYSFFQVYRKEAGGTGQQFDVWERNPDGKKRCLLIRYGAIGDAIIASAVFPSIKAQGYHLTVNCKPSTYDVLKHDPHVDEWIVQADNWVPNQALGPYWEALRERYDRFLNLCESIETTLLCHPADLRYKHPHDVRRRLFDDVNYLDRTHDICGTDRSGRPYFYRSVEECEWALKERAGKGPAVLWAVNGSAPHKVYPHIAEVLAWLLKATPAHIWLTADGGIGKVFQDAVLASLDKSGHVWAGRVHPMAGEWSIRQALSFAQSADCIVGPETGVLNAVAYEANPKVIYLSHSSHQNLTRDWTNAAVLSPREERVPCYPCHRLHYDWQFCNQDETSKAALCAAAISPEVVFRCIMQAVKREEAA